MNATTLVVFNDWIYGTSPVYTAHGLNSLLSSCSNMTVQAIVEQPSATSPTITVVKETACDERSFVTATTLISAAALPSLLNVAVGSGSNFAARSARLNISLGGTGTVMAKVKIIATLRTEFA